MRLTAIKSCYIGPQISPEQFIPEHFFLYLAKGSITGYDGHRKYILKPGNYCLVRKNALARYNKQKDNGAFEKVVIILDEKFLKGFQQRHSPMMGQRHQREAFLLLKKDELIPEFIRSLAQYYNDEGKISDTFADIKREELLLILLQNDPGLASILFDFGQPEKIDLADFMNRNYKFNVSMERFAYLTGRSLSAFKRDFFATFSATPGHWLTQKRLKEAYFLIENSGLKPSEIYLDLGFENFSHFSFAFKKAFGKSPSEVGMKVSTPNNNHLTRI